jgi:hypothetical protein
MLQVIKNVIVFDRDIPLRLCCCSETDISFIRCTACVCHVSQTRTMRMQRRVKQSSIVEDMIRGDKYITVSDEELDALKEKTKKSTYTSVCDPCEIDITFIKTIFRIPTGEKNFMSFSPCYD